MPGITSDFTPFSVLGTTGMGREGAAWEEHQKSLGFWSEALPMSSLLPERMFTSVLSHGERSRSAPNASMSEPHQLVPLLLL